MAKKQPSPSNFHIMLIGCVLGAFGLWWFTGDTPDKTEGQLRPVIATLDTPQIVRNEISDDVLRFKSIKEFDYSAGGYPSLSRAREEDKSFDISILDDPLSAFYQYDEAVPQEVVQAPLEDVTGITDEKVAESETVHETVPQALDDMPVLKDLSIMQQLGEKPKIVIIIDDMGIDIGHSMEVLDLQGPLTLAYLPYAEHIVSQTDKARGKGHALMVHMPMEPVSEIMMNTPGMLHTGLSAEEFQARLDDNLNHFEGFLGINNHMGSKLTQNEAAMNQVMQTLSKRGFYFIDSRTINNSIAAERATAYQVPVLVRDVFLDHRPDIDFVRNALASMEQVARRKGLAIAIGHPKEATIQGLKEWLPTLEAKGFELVTAEQVIGQFYPTSAAARNISMAAAQHRQHTSGQAASD